jgi:hypothetical protein
VADKREFRHAISVLKKQGLVSPKIDARKAVASTKDRGKRLDTLVRKYDDVISGKLQAVKVPASDLKTLRKQGFETAQKRVLVPKTKREIARFQGGKIKLTSRTGQERVILPVEFHNLEQYLQDLRKNAPLIDKLKKENEYFGIRFRGGQRANFYSSIESLIRDLSKYSFVTSPPNQKKQLDIFQNLEIMRISPSGALKVERTVSEKKPMSAAYARKHSKKQYRKTLRIQTRAARLRQQRRDWQRDYRASLKGKSKQEYKAAARKRAKKSRQKAKRKKK